VRAAMAELFTSWGAWCEVVESADEAVGILARFTPQVVVADYRLRSHRHGHEAIEAVRRQARRKIPAVLVTGDTAADRIREAQASGVTLLHKPVPASQLHQVLTELLRGDELNGGLAAASPESPASAAG
jgi:CheY-like chemotaxis protein